MERLKSPGSASDRPVRIQFSLEAGCEPEAGRALEPNIVLWLFWMGLVISGLLAVRYMFSADRRAEGLPTPPSVYQNIGEVDDLQLGPTHLRDDVWIVYSSESIHAVRSDPSCPLRMTGQSLVDCRDQVYSVASDPRNYLEGPEMPRGC